MTLDVNQTATQAVPQAVIDSMCCLERRADSTLDYGTHVSQILARAEACGVTTLINAGFDPETDETPWVDLQTLHTGVTVWRAVGLHPLAIRMRSYNRQLARVEHLLMQPGVVALGEIGLDTRDRSIPLDIQSDVLIRQLDIAQRRRVPVIIHCVKAVGRLFEILRDVGPLPAGGMLHGFSGPRDLIPMCLDLNLSMSFGTSVLDPNATRAHTAAIAVPASHMLVESGSLDCLGLAKYGPGYGPVCEPSSVVSVLKQLALLRKQSEHALAACTTANARRLFGLVAIDSDTVSKVD